MRSQAASASDVRGSGSLPKKDERMPGILRMDSVPRPGRFRATSPMLSFQQIEPSSPQPSVDRLSVTFAIAEVEAGQGSQEGSSAGKRSPRAARNVVQSSSTNDMQRISMAEGEEEGDEDDYSASVCAIMQRRNSSRRHSKRKRRPSSPFGPDAENVARRRSSVFTNSSGETAISVEDGGTQEQIFENLKLHKEVLGGVKQEPWPLRRKVKLVRQAKSYVRRHEGALQERLAQSRSTKDVIARISFFMAKKWQYFRRELVNLQTWLIPWELRIKEIESHFGSAVASYFTFLRWLFWINLVVAGTLTAFVAIPEVLTADANLAGERKTMLKEESVKSKHLLTLWDFEGILKYSPFFYGWYTNQDSKSGYRLPLAYFVTNLVVYTYSFVVILRKMAENSRLSKLTEKEDECAFSWKLFTGWDFMIGNPETAHNRTASIVLGFKEALLEEAEKEKDERNWKIITMRIFVNIAVISLLSLSAYAVVTVVARSTANETETHWWRQSETTIVMSLISYMFPIFFEILGFFENYHPRKQLRMQLARIMVLNLLNLYSLIFAQFGKINHMESELEQLRPTVTSCKHKPMECVDDLTRSQPVATLASLSLVLLTNITQLNVKNGTSQSVSSPLTNIREALIYDPSADGDAFVDDFNETLEEYYNNGEYPELNYNYNYDFRYVNGNNRAVLQGINYVGVSVRKPKDKAAERSDGVTQHAFDQDDTLATTNHRTSGALEDVTIMEEDVRNATPDTIYSDGIFFGDGTTSAESIEAEDNSGASGIGDVKDSFETLNGDSTLGDGTIYDDVTVLSEKMNETEFSDETIGPDDEMFGADVTDSFYNVTDFNDTNNIYENVTDLTGTFIFNNIADVNDSTGESERTSVSYDITDEPTISIEDSSGTSFIDKTANTRIIVNATSREGISSNEVVIESFYTTDKTSTTHDEFDESSVTSETMNEITTTGDFSTQIDQRDVPHTENNYIIKCYERVCTTSSPEVSGSSVAASLNQLDPKTRKKLRKLCWETMFGQELAKLTVMDLILTILSTLMMDFFRAVFVRFMNNCWCWDLEKQFPQYGDFKIAENILHLVYNQGMVWMGMFFSPGLTALNLLKLLILMYLRSWAVLTCNVPHEVVFRASRSNNFYFTLLLTMLFLCVLPVGYAIVWVEPSWHCGPFSGYPRIYNLATDSLKKSLPEVIRKCLDYIASPGIVIPLIVLMTLIIFYMVSLTGSLREANNDLKVQLRQERTEERRKLFRIAEKRQDIHETPFSRWKKILPALPANVTAISKDQTAIAIENAKGAGQLERVRSNSEAAEMTDGEQESLPHDPSVIQLNRDSDSKRDESLTGSSTQNRPINVLGESWESHSTGPIPEIRVNEAESKLQKQPVTGSAEETVTRERAADTSK